MHGWRDELRVAARRLARERGFTLAAVACLALGSGATSALFSLVDALLLRPPPFSEPRRLVQLGLRETERGPRPWAVAEFRGLHAPTFSALAARTFMPVAMDAGDGARPAQAELVSGDYFRLLRVTPDAGRLLQADDDVAGAPQAVAVISWRLRETRFAGAPDVLGRALDVNGTPVTVVGVAPRGFGGALQMIAADLWLPLGLAPRLFPGAPDAADELRPWVGVLGRLAPGTSIAQARAELAALPPRWPRLPGRAQSPTTFVEPLTGAGVPPAMRGRAWAASAALGLLVLLTLAVAAADVAGLQLARGLTREGEVAVRLALGASRWRVARGLLAESLLLALAGGLAGLALAYAAAAAFALSPPAGSEYVRFAFDARPDLRVWVASLLVAGLTGVAFGLAPAWHAGRVDVARRLCGAGVRGTRRATRLRRALVVGQLAATGVPVACALLLAGNSARALAHPDVDPRPLAVQSFALPEGGAERDRARLDALLERARALPGVDDAALASVAPLDRRAREVPLWRAESDAAAAPDARAVAVAVTPGHFRTLGATPRAGREFAASDAPGAPRVALVGQALAQLLWGQTPALGRRLRLTREGETVEVVGVTPDLRYGTLAPEGGPVVYLPLAQSPSPTVTLVVRTRDDPAARAAELRELLRAQLPEALPLDGGPLRAAAAELARPLVQQAALFGALGLLALVLAGVGLFGVVAFGVRARTREFGLRLALGATPSRLLGLVTREGLGLAALGIAAGLAAAAAATRLLAGQVFGLRPLGLLPALASLAVLGLTALVATWLPARQAARADPAAALRHE